MLEVLDFTTVALLSSSFEVVTDAAYWEGVEYNGLKEAITHFNEFKC